MQLHKLFLLLILPCFGACAHSIHQVYVGSMDAKKADGKEEWVTAESKEFVVLGFQSDTSYVERAYKELESKCPGRIAQVTTEHLTSYLLLSYNQKVVLKGLCKKT